MFERTRALLLIVVSATPLACGGGGSGGGGGGAAGCPDDCLGGTWTLTAQSAFGGAGGCAPLGAVGFEATLALIQSDSQFSLYALDTAELVMPATGTEASTLSFFVLRDPTYAPGFAGVCYVPGSDVTLQVSTSALPHPDQMVSEDQFVAVVDFESYDGYALTGTPQGGGVTAWEVDPGATLLCTGQLRIEGVRVGSSPASLSAGGDKRCFVGAWSWRAGEEHPLGLTLSPDLEHAVLRPLGRDSLFQSLFPSGEARLRRGHDNEYSDSQGATSLRLAVDDAGAIGVGELRVEALDAQVMWRGPVRFAPATSP